MNIFGITDQGMVRKQNQDSFFFWTDGEMGCAVVCDGMGGAQSGNIASAMATQKFAEVVGAKEGLPEERLLWGAERANAVVYHRAQHDMTCWGMGTTLVGALALNHIAVVINIGDSRCYHLSQTGITQVTRDHSLVAELVAMGRITQEEARVHPNRNIITRALGTDAQVRADLYQVPLEPGDLLLFCSDGLSNEVLPEEMKELSGEGTLEERCQRLLQCALDRGAPDNVTVVLMEAEE
ncbi:MAG: Stp1/IreP family PP2C-type Ser/Thr phosphatase [Oscillospiraceae bacterium]|nr:Stp1/IreP family PP2C-type Ser/Thr phosphatase [Oscillospiraceae bacterium]